MSYYGTIMNMCVMCLFGFFFLAAVLSTPGTLLVSFFAVVSLSVYYYYLMVSDIFSYFLFMVYIGGLLVLLIYMMMMSSNYYSASGNLILNILVFLVAGVFMMYFLGAPSTGYLNFSIAPPGYMEFSALLVLGALLTYFFIYICNIIMVGGSSMNAN
uniref:NADH dehydrogenase subunit 6 n=1 Tax=Laeocathaica amdoana TaxID=2936362 RepID=UPI0022FD6979|nr:NADH dehydrogenase subunit 6 [Laeocathaica amdoana]WBF92695.1 NADH dehydrogenase subunit 6 [Laeocathaica amdoana]